MIEFLLDRKFYDTDVSDYRGWTPLHAASFSGRLNVVMLLLERDSSNNTHNYTDKVTPLQLAASGGHLEVVQALLDHSNFDAAPLTTADVPQDVHYESIRVLERLLKHPDFKDINITPGFGRYGNGKRGLLSAMIRKKQYDCVQLLLSQPNIDVNLIRWGYREYYTPLILAIELGQTDIVELLLQHKNIDINAHVGRWEEGHYFELNALGAAKTKGNSDIIELLVAHGAKATGPELL
jgi:ankyrin repeat protein